MHYRRAYLIRSTLSYRRAGSYSEAAGWPQPGPALGAAMARPLVDQPCSGTGGMTSWRHGGMGYALLAVGQGGADLRDEVLDGCIRGLVVLKVNHGIEIWNHGLEQNFVTLAEIGLWSSTS